MDIDQFSNALVKLAGTEIGGVKEASVLFVLARGAVTSTDVIELTAANPQTTRMRLISLQERKLVVLDKSPKGRNLYKLTPSGKRLVDRVLKK